MTAVKLFHQLEVVVLKLFSQHRVKTGNLHGKTVLLETVLHLEDIAFEDLVGTVDERDMVTNLLHGGHVVRGKHDGGPFALQLRNLLLQQVRVDGVETAERFVQNEKRRFMENRGDELDFLLHPLGEFLHRLVPPLHNPELLEFRPQTLIGFIFTKSLQTREIHCLFPRLHLLVETAFFGKVTHLVGIVSGKRMVFEKNLAHVRKGDAHEHPDQGRFAGSVGSQQTENAPLRHGQGNVVKGGKIPVQLCNVLYFNYVHTVAVLFFFFFFFFFFLPPA